MRPTFRVVLNVVVAALLVASHTFCASAQSDEELRQLYFKRDFSRIEEFARAGDTRAEAWMGLIMNEAQRRTEAKEWYRRAAEKDNRFAIGGLAQMHQRDREYGEAARWHKRGAELGITNSQYLYASMLVEGQGIPMNEAEAFRWFSAASGGGHRYSNVQLAKLYFHGVGTAQDHIQAYAHIEVALKAFSEADVLAAEARALRNQLEARLLPEEIDEARQRARQLKPARYRW